MSINHEKTCTNRKNIEESFVPLSHSTHRVFSTDKYRPQSRCIIISYYNLRDKHKRYEVDAEYYLQHKNIIQKNSLLWPQTCKIVTS
jgi:hypothetical protein